MILTTIELSEFVLLDEKKPTFFVDIIHKNLETGESYIYDSFNHKNKEKAIKKRNEWQKELENHRRELVK